MNTSWRVAGLLAVALGCGGTDGDDGTLVSPDGSTEPSPAAGTWTGTWLSHTGVGGTETLSLSQTGGDVTGTVAFTGSPCFSAGVISGSVDGTTLSATVTAGAIEVTLQGVLAAGQLSGSYEALSAGDCTGDTGTFSAAK